MDLKDILSERQKVSIKKCFHALNRCMYFIPNLFCCFFPHNREVILESHPDFTCNTYAVYCELIRREFNKSYKLVWIVDNPPEFELPTNVDYVYRNPRKLTDRIKLYIRCNRALAVLCSNRHIHNYMTGRGQLNIYLGHGMPLKLLKYHGYPDEKFCSYLISQSDFFNPILADQFGIDERKIVTLGVPRNDELFSCEVDLSKIGIKEERYEKIIVWVPTFRNHKNKVRVDCHSNFAFGLPLLNSKEDINRLQAYLEKEKILLIVKPHPAQDLSVFNNLQCGNIFLLFDKEMLAGGLQTNEVLSRADAMITDYSGIYYDYLLLDRPVALTLDDFEQYKNEKGFCYDNPLELLCGYRVNTLDELLLFFDDVKNNVDRYYKDRISVKAKVNKYLDGQSSKRVVDFIIEKLKLQGE